MPRTAYIQTNFTAGELTPRLRARVNWEKYPNGVETLKNFVIQTHGPVTKRPGLRYVAEVKTSSKKVRLIPFEFSLTQSYILEFGEGYIRFYYNQGQVMNGLVPYEVTTSFTENDLFEIKYVQSADVLFLSHPDYPPQKLSRYDHTLWVLEDITFRNGPFLPWNTTATTIQPSARSGNVTLTAVSANGDELIENGSFDQIYSAEKVGNRLFSNDPDTSWTWGTGWSHQTSLGMALHTAGDADPLEQDIGVGIGKNYRVVYTVIGRSAGDVTVSLGGDTGTTRSADGTYTETLTTVSTANLAFTPSIDFAGLIDVISVMEVSADTYWTFGTKWSHNESTGKADHATGGTAALEQSILTTAGADYVISFTVSGRTAGSVTPYLGATAGAAVSSNTTSSQTIASPSAAVALKFVPSTDFDGSIDAVSCKQYGGTADVFQDDHIGSFWRLKHDSGSTVSTASTANPCLLYSPLHGLKTGDRITLSDMQPGVWSTLNGLEFSVTVMDANYFWIPYDTSGFSGYLASSGSWTKMNGGYCQITGVTDGQHASATVIDGFSNTTATADWAEGAWSDYRGYPGALTFFEERFYFAGTANQPQTIWGSVVGNYYDFFLGTSDDDGVEWTLSSEKLDRIQWLTATKVMLIGTSSGIWRLMASSLNEALSPTNFSFKKEISVGCNSMAPIATGIVALHVQRQNRRVRELAYNFEIDGYVSQDMTLLSEHITLSGVVDMDLQTEPDYILWCVLANGTMAAMTYERAQSVTGWQEHETDGDFESAVVIPGDSGDEVWCLVKRTINGATVRYVEFMEFVEGEIDDEDRFYVDCGSTYDGVPADVISGLSYLEGETVKVLADGAVHDDCVVASGSITLDAEYSVVQVGLGYDAILKTLPLEAGAAEGSAQGKIKRIHGITLMLADASGLYAGTGDADALLVETGTGLYSGDVYQAFPGGYDNSGQIYLKQSDPLPVTVQGIVPRVTTYDA